MLVSNTGFVSYVAMKIDRKYLSKAKEIRDKASGAKNVDQPVVSQSAAQAKVATTSKKRKCHLVSGGPSES